MVNSSPPRYALSSILFGHLFLLQINRVAKFGIQVRLQLLHLRHHLHQGCLLLIDLRLFLRFDLLDVGCGLVFTDGNHRLAEEQF